MNIERLRDMIEEAISPPPDDLADICGAYYSPYYHLMYLLAQDAQDGALVELGVEKGRGLAAYAMGSTTCTIMGVDYVHRPELDDVLQGFDNIIFHKMASYPPIDPGAPIRVLHIDTDHNYAQAKNDFVHYMKYYADDAVILWDDLHAMEDAVWLAFSEQPFPQIVDDRLHPSCGYGVMLYERR